MSAVRKTLLSLNETGDPQFQKVHSEMKRIEASLVTLSHEVGQLHKEMLGGDAQVEHALDGLHKKIQDAYAAADAIIRHLHPALQKRV